MKSGNGNQWNPETHPYGVVWTFQTGAHGLNGWDTRTEVYQTRAEAEAAASAPFPKGTKHAEIWVVTRAPARRFIGKRLPKQVLVMKEAA